jgi:hypothetical protein
MSLMGRRLTAMPIAGMVVAGMVVLRVVLMVGHCFVPCFIFNMATQIGLPVAGRSRVELLKIC